MLPVHQVVMEASLMPEEVEIRVKQREFYEAVLEPGEIGRPRGSVLRIEPPGENPAGLRLLKIKFRR